MRIGCAFLVSLGLALGLYTHGAAQEVLESKGRVIVVEDKAATITFDPQADAIARMVRTGLLRFTAKESVKEAWLSLVSTQDFIGLKVLSSPSNSGTRPAVVAQVIESMLQAGISPQKIVVWDRRISELRLAGFFDLAEKYHVRVAGSIEAGYDPETGYETPLLGKLVYGDLEFGKKGEGVGRKSYVSLLVSSNLTKIINITPLLNNNLAGVSGVLYGLSMGSVDNVLRFELDPERLSTAIPEIYAMPQLADRVVLNIVDALICQYQGEDRILLHYATPMNQLWFSKDPVALDVLALQELAAQRKRAGIPEPKFNRAIYSNAALLELGTDQLREMTIERITTGSP